MTCWAMKLNMLRDANPFGLSLSKPTLSLSKGSTSDHPELVEGLRQAQPERVRCHTRVSNS
jgi:hypothetical protein